MLLGSVEDEQLEAEEQRLAHEQREFRQNERARFVCARQGLRSVRAESADQLVHRGQTMFNQILRSEEDLIFQAQARHTLIRNSFAKVERDLNYDLADAKANLEHAYKELGVDYKNTRYNLAGRAHETADEGEPDGSQPIEVYVCLLRCVKDKLPRGRYVVLCSIIDQLGGNVIGSPSGRITAPQTHGCECHLDNLIFDESIQMVAPPKEQTKPSMAFLFELFLLKSKGQPEDRAVGWGVFPLINCDFEINKGRFKVPMLFGAVDPGLAKYSEIECAYRDNLDLWLANMYVEVRQSGMQQTVRLVLDEDSLQRAQRAKWLAKQRETERERGLALRLEIMNDGDESGDAADEETHEGYSQTDEKAERLQKRKTIIHDILETESDDGATQSLIEHERERRRRFRSAEACRRRKLRQRLADPDYLPSFTFHIPKRPEPTSRVWNKIRYVLEEALPDLALQSVATHDFWISFMVLITAAWIRAFLHTFGSWLLLLALRTEISVFSPMMYIISHRTVDTGSDWSTR